MENEPEVTNQSLAPGETAMCPKQDAPARFAARQVDHLKQRLGEKGINPMYCALVYSFDCDLHGEKASFHVDTLNTGTAGITQEGKTLIIEALEKTLAQWKKEQS